MARQTVKKQTIILTAAGILTRFAGFLMRIWLNRLLGAQVIGLVEQASSIQILAITPVSAGLPLSISRMTALHPDDDLPFLAGRRLALRIALSVTGLYLLALPFFCRQGTMQPLFPAMLVFAPCIFLIATATAYDGYSYGRGSVWPPAVSEITEQAVRFILCYLLFFCLPSLNLSGLTAIPSVAGLAAEFAGLVVMPLFFRFPKRQKVNTSAMEKKLLHLSLPSIFTRLCHTLLRSFCAFAIPFRLRALGFGPAESIARYGMLMGMALPFTMLPSVFSGSLAMVATPAIAAREKNPSALVRFSFRICSVTFLLCLCAAIMLYFLSPWIAFHIYHQAELVPLLRFICPLVLINGISQVLSGMMAGLGKQKQTFFCTLAGSLLNVILAWYLTAIPTLHIYGSALALMLSHLLSLFTSIFCFIHFCRVLVHKAIDTQIAKEGGT